MKRSFEAMKRRFASPLLIPRDSSLSQVDFSNLSNADGCLSQPEMRRFTSPLVVKRARESFVGSISDAKQISASSQPDDQSMEVPKTPKSSPKAESASRTVNRRLFHVADRCFQVSTLLSPTPRLRTSSRSDDRPMQAGRSSSESVDLRSQTVDNLALGGKATPFRKSNDISSSKPSLGRDEEFSQPSRNPLESELAPLPFNRDYQGTIGKAGNLSNLLRESNFVQRTKSGAPGGSHDFSMQCTTSLESPTKASSDTCSLEVFTHPLALQDIGALSYGRASALVNVTESAVMAANAKEANSPARSAKESELMDHCINKLKHLLVPTSVPFSNFFLQNQSRKSFIQIAFQLNMLQPWSLSVRDSITENAASYEAAQPETLVKEEASVTNSAVKTTRLMQEVSRGNNSHPRLPPQLQHKNSNHLQIICDGNFYRNNHPVPNSPQKGTKSDETRVCALITKERLSSSSLYIAQSLEFRSIWSSKRLKMAEIATSCLTQNEFLFSTLV